MKVLLTADLHIGRRSSRIPEHKAGPQHSCAEVWRRIVDLALAKKVDLVALAGDLIDRENRYFEAFGPLETGLDQLARAGIDTLAVAGNHDHDLLGRLDRDGTRNRFRVLGRDGRWEQIVIERPSGAKLAVAGWSFPRDRVLENPLETFDLEPIPKLPSLGILHADIEKSGSRYAPCSPDDLRARGQNLWLVGHGHKPIHLDSGAGPVVLNPGSPQAMDPAETGAHGCWLVELDAVHRPQPVMVPLSTVRYDYLEVEAAETEEADRLKERIVLSLLERLESLAASAGPLELFSCRVRITGRTRLHHRLEDELRDLPRELRPSGGRITGLVEKFLIESRPGVNLAELARGQSPPALLARLLLSLEKGEPAPAELQLLQDVQDRLASLYRAGPYNPLITDPQPDADAVAKLVLQQGRLLLDALLSQKDTAR